MAAAQHRPLYDDIKVDDAWYSGDADRLAKVYRYGPQTRKDGRRRLWGRHRQPGKREQRLHIPLAGEIAQTSADLLFADTPVITVGTPRRRTASTSCSTSGACPSCC